MGYWICVMKNDERFNFDKKCKTISSGMDYDFYDSDEEVLATIPRESILYCAWIEA